MLSVSVALMIIDVMSPRTTKTSTLVATVWRKSRSGITILGIPVLMVFVQLATRPTYEVHAYSGCV